MKNKKKKIIIIGVIIFIIIIAIISIFFGLKGSSKEEKNKNNFVYDPTIPIDEVKEDKNKALYMILFQTEKKVEDYELLEKNSDNHYVYYDKSVNECYEVNLEENRVITKTNCR